jgi:predicted nucleic acid-binding protein
LRVHIFGKRSKIQSGGSFLATAFQKIPALRVGWAIWYSCLFMNTTHSIAPRNRDHLTQDTMFRQIFASPIGNLTIAIPQSWHGQKIEVIAFPVNDTFDAPHSSIVTSDQIAENRKNARKTIGNIRLVLNRWAISLTAMRQIIMMNNFAVDTNIILYLRDMDSPEKLKKANDLIDFSPVVSSQVISEYLNASKRLLRLPKEQILDICLDDLEGCNIQPVTLPTLRLARELIPIYDFQLFDGIIVASSLEAGCEILYSEDFQHNQLIENRLRIINPFI